MTQISRPQQGRYVIYPDAGGFTSNQWARILRVLATDPTAQGPFYSYLSSLEVSNPASVTIRVASGMGLVNGRFLINEDPVTPANTSNVDFTPSTPGIASRNDIVVMVQNNTAVAYDGTPDYGAAVLEFPTDLTDYLSASSIPPHSCRLAILTGDEGAAGAARTPQQDEGVDGDIYMVAIATYTISNAPAISALSTFPNDYNFVDAEMQDFFVTAPYGWYEDTPDVMLTAVPHGGSAAEIGWITPDGEDSWVHGFFTVPSNFISSMVVSGVAVPVGVSGDLYRSLRANYGECGASVQTHTDVDALAAEAITSNLYNCTVDLALASVAVDDIVALWFQRDASNVLDTVNADVRFPGFIVEYFGYKR